MAPRRWQGRCSRKRKRRGRARRPLRACGGGGWTRTCLGELYSCRRRRACVIASFPKKGRRKGSKRLRWELLRRGMRPSSASSSRSPGTGTRVTRSLANAAAFWTWWMQLSLAEATVCPTGLPCEEHGPSDPSGGRCPPAERRASGVREGVGAGEGRRGRRSLPVCGFGCGQ